MDAGYFDEDEFDGLDLWHKDYVEDSIEELLENDQISAEEAGFMHGTDI